MGAMYSYLNTFIMFYIVVEFNPMQDTPVKLVPTYYAH
jgi:hypothetical protein